MATLFSKIIAGEIPCHKIEENEKFLAFLDIAPLVKGHTLVVPKVETDYIFDLNDEYLQEIMVFAKNVAAKVRKAMPCQRIGVAVIGLEVPHAHVHLVPINSADDLNFTRPKLKLTQEELIEIAAAINKV
ncbi:MAG TPA: HIT family protein [Flavobacteriales bacterium]|nr:HIT family protein [Flavobacteriales bacterium]